jgi:hypothetical protein
MGVTRNEHRILAWKPFGKLQLERDRRRSLAITFRWVLGR